MRPLRDTEFRGKVSSTSALSVDEADIWDDVVQSVRAEYLSDSQNYPWIIGFSGGKDSTVCCTSRV